VFDKVIEHLCRFIWVSLLVFKVYLEFIICLNRRQKIFYVAGDDFKTQTMTRIFKIIPVEFSLLKKIKIFFYPEKVPPGSGKIKVQIMKCINHRVSQS
jgi:hypothetical protein